MVFCSSFYFFYFIDPDWGCDIASRCWNHNWLRPLSFSWQYGLFGGQTITVHQYKYVCFCSCGPCVCACVYPRFCSQAGVGLSRFRQRVTRSFSTTDRWEEKMSGCPLLWLWFLLAILQLKVEWFNLCLDFTQSYPPSPFFYFLDPSIGISTSLDSHPS